MNGRVLSEVGIKLAREQYKRYEYEMVYCGSDMSALLDIIVEQDTTIRDRDKTIEALTEVVNASTRTYARVASLVNYRDKTIADYEGTISRLDHDNHVMGEALNVIAMGTAELNGHKHPLAVIAQEALALIADKGDE